MKRHIVSSGPQNTRSTCITWSVCPIQSSSLARHSISNCVASAVAHRRYRRSARLSRQLPRLRCASWSQPPGCPRNERWPPGASRVDQSLESVLVIESVVKAAHSPRRRTSTMAVRVGFSTWSTYLPAAGICRRKGMQVMRWMVASSRPSRTRRTRVIAHVSQRGVRRRYVVRARQRLRRRPHHQRPPHERHVGVNQHSVICSRGSPPLVTWSSSEMS
jgi:hypothetical protein